jgi:hypothetical protein
LAIRAASERQLSGRGANPQFGLVLQFHSPNSGQKAQANYHPDDDHSYQPRYSFNLKPGEIYSRSPKRITISDGILLRREGCQENPSQMFRSTGNKSRLATVGQTFQFALVSANGPPANQRKLNRNN